MNAPTPTSPAKSAVAPSTQGGSAGSTIPTTPGAGGAAKPPIVGGTSGSASSKPSISPSASKPVALRGTPPFEISKPSTASGRWLNLLAYGKPGSGKTTLLGTAADIPDMRDILYVDAERGNLAVEENPRIKSPSFLTDNRVSVTGFKQVAMVHDFLKAHCKFRDEQNFDKLREQESWLRGVPKEEITEPKMFRTVMVDSLTEVDIYCTYGLLGITQDKVLHGESSDIDVARFDEFRKNNQMMQMLVRAFRDLPIHFLASAGRVYAEDDLKKRYYSPALTGQLKTQIPGFFDIVGYMDSQTVGDKVERKLWINPVKNFEAKNRRAVYRKDYFEDPFMSTIMEGIGLLSK